MNQSEASQSDSWAFFDKIYCISLESRPDRREQAGKQFADVGLLQRVEFVIVTKHPVHQEKGIFQSHMLCLEKGLAAKARHILIFEDDVFFRNFVGEVLAEAVSYLGTINWNGLFLGCITNGSSRIEKTNLARIRYRCLAHAYALNQPFAQRIVQETWSGIPFDELLRRHSTNFFALNPMCAFQGLAGTDNQTVAIDRMRRLFGGLPFIQRVNELYHNNKVFLLASLIVLPMLLALLTLVLW